MINITYIYLIENIDNDPYKVYIGKSKNPQSRNNNHKSKYGDNIQFNIIDTITSLDHNQWKPIETMWIQTFISWGFKVVNIRKEGGSGVGYHTDESRIKMSNSIKGRKCTWGDKISKSTILGGKLKNPRCKKLKVIIQKISTHPKYQKPKGFGNRDPKPQLSKTIIQYDLDMMHIHKWSCIKEAINKTNIKGIYNCLTGRAKSAGGYIWCYSFS